MCSECLIDWLIHPISILVPCQSSSKLPSEIIRMSHCGKFYYNDRWVPDLFFETSLQSENRFLINIKFHSLSFLSLRYVHGCLQSCSKFRFIFLLVLLPFHPFHPILHTRGEVVHEHCCFFLRKLFSFDLTTSSNPRCCPRPTKMWKSHPLCTFLLHEVSLHCCCVDFEIIFEHFCSLPFLFRRRRWWM